MDANRPGTFSQSAAPDAGLNREICAYVRQLANLPRPTREQYASAEFIHRRAAEAMEAAAAHGLKPTVNGLACALGITRQELAGLMGGYATTTGSEIGLTHESIDAIKDEYQYLAMVAETALMESKRSPIAGIFLAKNHFGYTNETTVHHDATPRTAAALQSADAIAQRYAAILGAMPATQPPALEAEILEVEDAPEDDERRE